MQNARSSEKRQWGEEKETKHGVPSPSGPGLSYPALVAVGKERERFTRECLKIPKEGKKHAQCGPRKGKGMDRRDRDGCCEKA